MSSSAETSAPATAGEQVASTDYLSSSSSQSETQPASGDILVVDDNRLNREMLARRLSRRGYSITEAHDGNQALELIDKSRFDLALFDIMMPGLSGLEALAEVRKRFSPGELPVIMATAKTQSEDIVEALRLGANDYVTKPIDFPVLLARVQTHMNLKRLFKLKDEFLSIASHDLKNPLFVIVCQAYLMQTKLPVGTPMTPEGMDMINKVAELARTMQGLIADFLDFQAAEDGQLRLQTTNVDLNTIIRTVVQTQEDYARQKGIELETDLADSLPAVPGDANRLEQVVTNLIGNAIKYSPRSGRAIISTLPEQGGGARFEITDSGPGLKDDDFKRVFVKYGKLSSTPTGGEKSTGIGLAICKKMIDLHGGQIGVRNAESGGATFWFTIPATPPPAIMSTGGNPGLK